MLPSGLRLAPQSVTPGDQHPLLFMLGRQRNVRLDLIPFGADYLEFILAVPFVEHDGSGDEPSGPFAYMPCLFLDRRLPILGGRLLLAYEKHRAVISATAETYRIASVETGELLLSARFRATPRSSNDRRRPAIEGILRLPVVSRRARGGWRYSVFEPALERARIEPIEIDLAIERPFVPGLPTGSFTLDTESGQAFRLQTSWRLTGPFASRSPPHHAGLDNRPQKQ